jgi:hypothetical protein
MERIKEELQKKMAIRYDAEFTQMADFIEQAYVQGIEDGKASAKAEIINLINGGQ